MQGRGQDIGDIQCLFVGNGIGNWEKIDFPVRDTHPFCLASREAACEVRVSENTAHAVAVHAFVEGGGVGAVACCGKTFFTVSAFTAGNAEAVNHSLSDAEVTHGWADGLDNADEFVSQEVSLL